MHPRRDLKRLFFFFIDGLGLGDPGPENPVSRLFAPVLGGRSFTKISSPLSIEGGIIVPLDAVQGVPGIPQSATGQTSLYTGLNAQKIAGCHLTALPNPRLMRLIRERSLLKKLKEGKVSVTSANLYTQNYFTRRSRRRKNMFPVSVLSMKSANIPFRMQEDYLKKRALFADITNRHLKEQGRCMNLITPEEGAHRIHNLLGDYQAVFFEYFITDVYGHKRNREALEIRLDELNRFLPRLLELVREDRGTSVLVVSDHGNVEDFSTGDHTFNPVPLLFFSKDPAARERAGECRRLVDVYCLVLDYFGIEMGLSGDPSLF